MCRSRLCCSFGGMGVIIVEIGDVLCLLSPELN